MYLYLIILLSTGTHQVYDVLDLCRFMLTMPSPIHLLTKSIILTNSVKTHQLVQTGISC